MSFRILSFNISTEICSVALMVGSNIYERSEMTSFQHEKKILLMIDNLLSDVDITLQSLNCLVFSYGPGSFIGVRIGISLAQGLALGANLPLVQVSSLEILAEGIWRLLGAKQVLATINARLGELYLGCYYFQDNGQWLRKGVELIITPLDICKFVSNLDGKWALVGTGWDRYPILFSNSIVQINVRKILYPSAKDMLPFAVVSLKRGNLLTVNEVKPIYIGGTRWSKKLL